MSWPKDMRWLQICTVPSRSNPLKKYAVKVDRSISDNTGRVVLSCGCPAFRFKGGGMTRDDQRDCKHLDEVRRRILDDEKFRGKLERELGVFIDIQDGGMFKNFASRSTPLQKRGAGAAAAVTVAVDTTSHCPICHSHNDCGDEIITCQCGVEYINPNL